MSAENMREDTVVTISGTTASYWQQYGLQRDPFQNTSENAFFTIAQWESDLDLMQHLSQYSNVFQVISGDIDVGKTTLMESLQARLDQELLTYQIDADPKLDATELLQILEDAFELPSIIAEAGEIEEKFARQLDNLRKNHQQCVLLIDDAQLLPRETLITLCKVIGQQSEDAAHLHVVLFGDPELYLRIEEIQAECLHQEEILHNIELKPLSFEETEQYLESVLTKSGLVDVFPFSTVDIDRIYKLSDGYIGRINSVTKQLMIDKLSGGVPAKRPKLRLVNKLLMAAIVVLAGIIVTLVFNNKNPQTATSKLTKQAPKLPVLEQVKKTVVKTEKYLLSQIHGVKSEHLKTVKPTRKTVVKPIKIVKKPQKWQDHIPAIPAVMINNEPSAKEKQQALAAALAKYKAQMRNVAVVDKVIVIPQNYKATKKHSIEKAKKPHVVTVKKVKAKKTTAAAKKQPSTKQALRVANKQLLETNKKFYTLQLLGTHSETSARAFIKAKKIAGHSSYFKVELNGKPWFVLVYGRYKSRAEAQQAIKTLPKSLKGLKPWPRSFANIHSAINNVKLAKKSTTAS